MNIENDYLWDRRGEPDPEVKELEEILGTLRYQPRALEIPADLVVDRKRSFFRDFGPPLAIAATIAMLLLALGVWLGLQRSQPAPLAVTRKAPEVKPNPAPAPAPPPSETPNSGQTASSPASDQKLTDQKLIETPRPRVSEPVVARSPSRVRKQPANAQEVAKEQEGKAAKDQLMQALRMASLKLNIVQKKTQNINSREMIHNQHKIG